MTSPGLPSSDHDLAAADLLAGAHGAAPPAPLGRLGRVLALAAGLMILFMMTVTAIDVVGRYFFNRPLPGAFEFTEIMMGLVIFAGMPLATAAREHITVNFLEKAISRRARCLQAALADVVCAAVTAVLAWRVLVRGATLVETGEVTLVLGVGRGYIAWAMAALAAVTAVVFLYAGWIALRAALSREPPS